MINKLKRLFSGLFSGSRGHSNRAEYAFLIHPRYAEDIYRKYPFLWYLPERLLESVMYFWPPVVVSVIKGVKSLEKGHEMRGLLIGVPFTPSMMKKWPKRFHRSVEKALKLAEGKGVKVIGLGGWIPSQTGYGMKIRSAANGIGITTGHSLAAWTITQYVKEAVRLKTKELKGAAVVAVLGAAGSTGMLTIQTLAETGLSAKFLLIDHPNRLEGLTQTVYSLRESSLQAEASAQLSSLKEADVIVVLTSAQDAILCPEHVKDGAVIIDDTQPRNTRPDIAKKALVLDVLSVVPGLRCSFEMGLVKERPDITFTCLAEVATLASNGWHRDFSIGRPEAPMAHQIAAMASAAGITPAPRVSFGKLCERGKFSYAEKSERNTNIGR